MRFKIMWTKQNLKQVSKQKIGSNHVHFSEIVKLQFVMKTSYILPPILFLDSNSTKICFSCTVINHAKNSSV